MLSGYSTVVYEVREEEGGKRWEGRRWEGGGMNNHYQASLNVSITIRDCKVALVLW